MINLFNNIFNDYVTGRHGHETGRHDHITGKNYHMTGCHDHVKYVISAVWGLGGIKCEFR